MRLLHCVACGLLGASLLGSRTASAQSAGPAAPVASTAAPDGAHLTVTAPPPGPETVKHWYGLPTIAGLVASDAMLVGAFAAADRGNTPLAATLGVAGG